MKTAKAFAVLTICFLSILLNQANAQVIFWADFDNNAIPNGDVNEVGNWNGPNGTIWAVDESPGTDGMGLHQTVEGCGVSGNTPLPGNIEFSDGIIQLEMTAGDDDSWGVVFRQSAADRGYLVTFGVIETPQVLIAKLDDGCGADGQCNDQTGCENGGKELASMPHGMALGQGNNTPTFGRIEAQGDTIKIWYMLLADVPDPFVGSAGLGAPLLEIQDGSHASGAVGIWHESMNNSYVDNIIVTGRTAFAVDARKKLTTAWGYIKNSR